MPLIGDALSSLSDTGGAGSGRGESLVKLREYLCPCMRAGLSDFLGAAAFLPAFLDGAYAFGDEYGQLSDAT